MTKIVFFAETKGEAGWKISPVYFTVRRSPAFKLMFQGLSL